MPSCYCSIWSFLPKFIFFNLGRMNFSSKRLRFAQISRICFGLGEKSRTKSIHFTRRHRHHNKRRNPWKISSKIQFYRVKVLKFWFSSSEINQRRFSPYFCISLVKLTIIVAISKRRKKSKIRIHLEKFLNDFLQWGLKNRLKSIIHWTLKWKNSRHCEYSYGKRNSAN